MSSSEGCLTSSLSPVSGGSYASKCPALKAGWQVHSLKCLAEATSKCQALKAGWQVHSLKCLVEATSKCQTLKAGWQVCLCQYK